MNQIVNMQELVIVVAIKNHNPTILTPDFLKYSGIIPADWELAREALSTNRITQVVFANGISIIAEPTRVIFGEVIVGKATTAILLPSIIRKYVETLPNVDYQAVGINPIGYVEFKNQPDAARKYLAETLLSTGAWQEVGTAPVQATLNLTYTLLRGQFNLSVNSTVLKQADETTTPIVLFSGNFSYDVASIAESERRAGLAQAIENWQADLKTYQDIVNTKFLASSSISNPVAPDLFAISPVPQLDELQTLSHLQPLPVR